MPKPMAELGWETGSEVTATLGPLAVLGRLADIVAGRAGGTAPSSLSLASWKSRPSVLRSSTANSYKTMGNIKTSSSSK